MPEYIGIEKRRSPRVPNGIRVRLAGERLKRFGTVLNTSIHGMLVRTNKYFTPEEKVDLLMYLPRQSHPIYAKGRVVRTVTKVSAWGFLYAEEVGIEFLDMTATQRERLVEAIDTLLNKAL